MTRSTFTPADAAELAVIERSGFIESRHIGSAIVLSPDGSPLISLGDPEAPVFTRSSLKPLQAIAAMSLGAKVSGRAAALSMASHRSESGHAEVVQGMLDSAGLGVDDLRCPSAHPADGAFRRALQERARAAGDTDTDPTSPLYFNCSGKHTAFLMAALAVGADTKSYLDPDHPVQARVAEVVASFAEETPAAVGTDGCGAPVYALSRVGLARAIGRVVRLGSAEVSPAHTDSTDYTAFAAEATTLMGAVFADPWAIEGHGRPNTTVIERLGVFAKGGAEGVIVMSTKSGYSVALKCLDGSSRPTSWVALNLLEMAGAFDEENGLSARGGSTLEELFEELVEPVTGGTDSEGRTSIVGTLTLGEDIAKIR